MDIQTTNKTKKISPLVRLAKPSTVLRLNPKQPAGYFIAEVEIMNLYDATGHTIGEVRLIGAKHYVCLVGAFTDPKTKEPFSRLTWYQMTGKQINRYIRTGKAI